MHPNRQQQFCDELIQSGRVSVFLEELMQETAQEDHLPAITRNVYLDNAEKLDLRLRYDAGTALILLILIEDEMDNIVRFQKKEVGALIRFPQGATGNITAIASIDYLLSLPAYMNLNDGQVLELEYLLNKKDRTLGVPLPTPREATQQEQKAVLMEVALSVLQTKPKVHYQSFLDAVKATGTSVSMTQKEFVQFAEEILRP